MKHPNILRRVTSAILAAGLAVITVGASRSSGETPLETYARPGSLVKVAGGRELNIRCTGTAGPAVILTAGAGDQSLTWRSIQSALSGTARVCAWDRAGTGFSDPSDAVQDVLHRTDDLEALLKGAGVAGPYILVGHSLGSFETLMFAFRHPEKVAGIVLIDPSSPNQDERLKKAAPAFYSIIDTYQQGALAQARACAARSGGEVVTGEGSCEIDPPAEYPPQLRQALIRLDSRVAARRNQLSLMESMFSGADTRQLQATWHSLGDIPITVLTAGAPPPVPVEGETEREVPLMQAEWARMHDEIAALSQRGSHRTVPGATHYIYRDKPEVVIDAVQEMIATRPRQ